MRIGVYLSPPICGAVVHRWQLSLAACAYESICFDFPLPRHDELTALVDLLRCGRTSDLSRFPFSSRFISGYACATAIQKRRPSAALGPRCCLLDEPDLRWACEARGLGTRARAGAARAFGRARHLALRAGFREGVWATPQCVLRCAALHADAALRCMSPTSVGMRSTVALCV